MIATVILRVLLAVAYPLLAHRASVDANNALAALALLDLALVMLLAPLARGRVWSWLLLAGIAAGLWTLRTGEVPVLLLLAPPALFAALIAWFFGRSLGGGRVPVITRIVSALEGCGPDALEPRLRQYSWRLTLAWSMLLALLALADASLAVIAVPDGVLARLGYPPLVSVSQRAWSWFANLLDYGILVGFFLGEYLLRQRLFPEPPYRNFLDFLRRMGQLGPAFWRDLFR